MQMARRPIYTEILNTSILIDIPTPTAENPKSTPESRVTYMYMYAILCGEKANVAALATENEMDFAIWYPRSARLCQTTKMNLLTSSNHQSFALQKNSPYTDAFRLR